MNNKRTLVSLLAMIGAVGLLAGCGTAVAGGGQPVPQPITAQSSGNGNTGTNSGTQSTTPTTGGTGGGASSTPSTSTGNGGAQQSKGTNTQPSTTGSGMTGSATGTGTATGTSAAKGSGTKSATQAPGSDNAKSNKPVTIAVGSTIALTATPVTSTGAGGQFVPVSSSVTSVLLPAHWTVQTTQDGSEGTTIRMTNPKDSTQSIVELIQTSARDLNSFYNGQATGAVHWIVPQQIAAYTFVNPENPNPDRGIMANLSTGGSLRLDVYLPKSEGATAQAIINSFINQTASS